MCWKTTFRSTEAFSRRSVQATIYREVGRTKTWGIHGGNTCVSLSMCGDPKWRCVRRRACARISQIALDWFYNKRQLQSQWISFFNRALQVSASQEGHASPVGRPARGGRTVRFLRAHTKRLCDCMPSIWWDVHLGFLSACFPSRLTGRRQAELPPSFPWSMCVYM